MTTDIEQKIDPAYDLFREAEIDSSSEAFEYLPYYEVTPTAPADKNRWSITLADQQEWHLMSKAVVQVTARVLKGDGTAYSANEKIAPVNNAWNFFSKAVLRMGGQELESIANPGEVTTMTGCGEMSKNYADSIATGQFWYPDTGAGAMDEATLGPLVTPTMYKVKSDSLTDGVPGDVDTYVVPVYPPATPPGSATAGFNDADYNWGFHERWKLTKNSKSFTVFLPANRLFGYLKSVRTVTRGVPFAIELEKAAESDCLYRDAGLAADGVLRIDTLQVWIPALRPNPVTALRLEAALKSGAVSRTVFSAYNCGRKGPFTAPGGAMTSSVSIGQTSRRVSRVYVAFKAATRLHSQIANTDLFDPIALTQIQLRVGNTQFPRQPVRVTQGTDMARAYFMLADAHRKLEPLTDEYRADLFVNGCAITLDQFQRNYMVYAFDLSHSDAKLFSMPVDVSIEYSATPTGTYYICAAMEEERRMELRAADGRLDISF